MFYCPLVLFSASPLPLPQIIYRFLGKSLNSFPTSSNTLVIPPPRAPITKGTSVTSYSPLISNANCGYFFQIF